MFPRCHTHYSLQVSATRAAGFAKSAIKQGYSHLPITDLGGVSGMVEGFAAVHESCRYCGNPRRSHGPDGKLLLKGETCPGYDKCSMTPVAGIELYTPKRDATDRSSDNELLSRITLLSYDRAGWDRLVRITSESNRPDRFTTRARLDLETTASYSGQSLCVIDGYCGSVLANSLWHDSHAAYATATVEQARSLLRDNWLERGLETLGHIQELFGPENVHISTGSIAGWGVSRVVAECVTKIAVQAAARMVESPDVYYALPDDAADQRVMLSGKFRCSLQRAIVASEKPLPDDPVGYRPFFKTSRFSLPDSFGGDEALFERFTPYSLENQPMLPDFPCPDGLSPKEYIAQVAREGWTRVFGSSRLPPDVLRAYGERAKLELDVIDRAGLAPYFLIVRDYVQWAKDQGMLVGAGRGSCAGSLLSYLLNITQIDPLKWDLLFERFYNPARITPGKVSLPDIDCDFPIAGKQRIFGYIRSKYGDDCVAQIATFSPLKARSAIKEVLKSRGQLGEAEINELTKKLPYGEAAISDELQEMAEEEGSFSVLRWSIENEDLSEYVHLNEQGELDGPLAYEFAQAIRLEGVNRTRGKHPAGVVVASRPIGEICPIIYDKKTKTPICGFNLSSVERVGLVKLDVLGLGALDKLQTAQRLLAERRTILGYDLEAEHGDDEEPL